MDRRGEVAALEVPAVVNDPMIPLLVGVFVLVLVVLAVIARRRTRQSFADRYPPISDAEFLARCRPGTDPEVALRVRRIIADRLGVDYERVYPSMSFVEDVGTD